MRIIKVKVQYFWRQSYMMPSKYPTARKTIDRLPSASYRICQLSRKMNILVIRHRWSCAHNPNGKHSIIPILGMICCICFPSSLRVNKHFRFWGYFILKIVLVSGKWYNDQCLIGKIREFSLVPARQIETALFERSFPHLFFWANQRKANIKIFS